MINLLPYEAAKHIIKGINVPSMVHHDQTKEEKNPTLLDTLLDWYRLTLHATKGWRRGEGE
jgi:hypothetical protein